VDHLCISKKKSSLLYGGKINAESELINKPFLLDTTRANFSSYKEIYGIFSSNK
jgi:hypothetical protein